MTKGPSEHDIQKEFVAWFRRVFFGVFIYAIPNGGLRHNRTAGLLKAEGAVAGVPDLHVPEWRLYIEMKRPRQPMTEDQVRVSNELRRAGYAVCVAQGLDEAKRIARAYAKTNDVPELSEEEGRQARIDAYTARQKERRR